MRRFLMTLVLALVATTLIASPFGWVVNLYDLTATSYTYCTSAVGGTPTCGTAATDGWIYMPDGRPSIATVEWVTKNATSLDYTIECRAYTSSAGQALLTDQLTAVGAENLVITVPSFDQCRIGLKLTSDTGANSVNAYFASRS